MTGPISAEEVEGRLVALCTGSTRGLPRRQRDLHILLTTAMLWMRPGDVYTQAEVDERLGSWLEEGCPALQTDHVTLRRTLVDYGYLTRDDSGRHYSPGSGYPEFQFQPDVRDLDAAQVIAAAEAEREVRRRRHVGETP